MIPGYSPIKIIQMVLISCISRSKGRKIGFWNAFFKNLFVWNYTAQRFHIWDITPSRGPLPKLFKLCPWGHNFTLNYIRKTTLPQTTSFLEPLMEIWLNSTRMIPGPLRWATQGPLDPLVSTINFILTTYWKKIWLFYNEVCRMYSGGSTSWVWQ